MTTDRPFTILVTGSGGPLGVNVTRSLRRVNPGQHGQSAWRIVGTDANRWHLPLSLCDETYRIPFARDRDGYLAALIEIHRREHYDVLIPTHPVEVRAVAELRDAGLLPDVGIAIPRTSVLDICDDKVATQRALAAADIPVPRTIVLTGPKDIERAFAELASAPGEPIWIRGSGAPGLGIGGAALPCRDAGVATAWVAHHGGWSKMSASEYLPGDNLSWMGAYCNGELIAAGSRQRLEYVLPHVSPSGITGAPAVSHTVAREDVAAIGQRAVSAVDDKPHGVYFVDLKGDTSNAPYVTEINAGRCGTTIEAYTEAGYNFPELLVRMAAGESVEPLADPNRAVEANVYWVRTLDCGPVALRGDSAFDRYPVIGEGE